MKFPHPASVIASLGLATVAPAWSVPQSQVEQPPGTILTGGATTVDFRAVLVLEPTSKTFVIRNSGDSDLTITGLSLGGSDAGDFEVLMAPASPVVAGGNTFFRIGFTPGAPGPRNASLSFTTNQPGAENFSVNLTGNGEAASGTRIHVNANSTGNNDGTTWEHAFTSLQSAIVSASVGDEIWVAAGTYKPAASDRTASFQLKNGVRLFGGFSGLEASLSERSIATNPTILSGDLLGNDSSNVSHLEGTRADNSVHVVNVGATATTGAAIPSPTRIDGFIIEGGNANGNPSHYGGGLYLGFTANADSNVTVANCVVRRNSAVFDGAGILNSGNIVIESCVFDSNRAGNAGSAILNGDGSSPKIVNCVFTRNQGGSVVYSGDTYARPEMVNCTFGFNGGPVVNAAYASPLIRNCIFWHGDATPVLTLDAPTQNLTSPGIVENCLVKGGFPGTGNLAASPLFINAALPEGPDGRWGTDDDGLRVSSASPVTDAGNTGAVLGLVTKDLRGFERTIGIVDMGAYENLADTDHDGLADIHETGTGIFVSATDTGSSPTDPDSDVDGLPDGVEVGTHGSNPNLADSDGDGFDDAFEVNTGFNPVLSSSTPDTLSSIRTAVEFRFNAATGASYRIEASADLATWNTIETGIAGQGAVVTRFYSTEGQPKRYFRARRN